MSLDSFGTARVLRVGDAEYRYFSLPALEAALGLPVSRLPFSIKVLLENLVRHEDGVTVTREQITALAQWRGEGEVEVAFHPARILMPDSSGLPLLIDFAAMRDAVQAEGVDPRRVNPRIPVDLVLDHSVRVDYAGTPDAFEKNLALEMRRNAERYGLVRWAMEQYDNLRIIPPANGILHQVNLEYLADVVTARDGLAFPDSLLGMDSHTPMINGMGVFGWGVGGIEAGTAMLGQPVGMLAPRVVGCRLHGTRRPGVMCTDIVLSLTQFLRKADVLAAVVEFFGPGLDQLSLPDRATIANMAAEYGATMGFFPVDAETTAYLRLTGRDPALVEAYCRAQGLWRDATPPDFAEVLEFDLGSVEPCLAGPARPEDRVTLGGVAESFRTAYGPADAAPVAETVRPLRDGDIAIASITSCTNTSNPFQVIAAGLLAQKARARGLRTKPWVKTSFSPGSRVVTAMLLDAGLMPELEGLGFHLAGYGCMSCGGGAGPLPDAMVQEIQGGGIKAMAVLSSNRNFEGRLHPQVRGTYLASPPLVVAYAIAGSVLADLESAVGVDASGAVVTLAELWPSDSEITAVLHRALRPELFRASYGALADGGPAWRALRYGQAPTFDWDAESLYLKRPPFLEGGRAAGAVTGARVLLLLGDNVTTDHISPGGVIPADAPAGQYLIANGVGPGDFSTYVARRANHEVMVRGTFANIRLRNEMVPGQEGGFTRFHPGGAVTTVFDAAEQYRAAGVKLVVVAGSNYGCGSSRDWAAKGTLLLGVRAVIAESFERIHRSNLVGMGVVPLQFPPGVTRRTLGLDGSETIDLPGLGEAGPGATVTARIHRADGSVTEVPLRSRVDTRREADWVQSGGILPYVFHDMVAEARAA